MARSSDTPTPFDQGLFLVHLNRGKECFGKRNYGEAAQELNQARRMRPTDETVLNLLGLAYFKLEKYQESDKIYRQLIEVNSISDVLHFNQGLVCFKLGALDRAEAAFLRALELVPENPKVNFYLGNIYEKKKQFYNAIFQYRKAGANIMVKRVQVKIEAERKEASGTSGEETLPPRRRTPVESPISTKLPSEQETSQPETKVTVDHIDRLLFLGALQQTPYSSLEPDSSAKNSQTPSSSQEEGEQAQQDASSHKVPDESPDEPSETTPAAQTNRTVVELTEPVIPDLSLTEMASSKVPTSATSSLFTTSPPTTPGPRRRSERSDEDTAKFGVLKDEPIRPESAPLRQHLSLSAEKEKDSTQLYSRLRRRDDIFRYLEDNLMEVNFSGKVFVKQGTIYSYSGNLTFWVKPQREEAVSPLVIVSGTGKLLLSDRQRDITVLKINGEEVFVEPSHLLACQETLTPRYALIKKEDAPDLRLQVLSIEGTGMLALSVTTNPLVVDVTPGFPINVSSANIISWSGELAPSIVDDEALEELMYPHTGKAFNLRLEGSGKVMMEKLTG